MQNSQICTQATSPAYIFWPGLAWVQNFGAWVQNRLLGTEFWHLLHLVSLVCIWSTTLEVWFANLSNGYSKWSRLYILINMSPLAAWYTYITVINIILTSCPTSINLTACISVFRNEFLNMQRLDKPTSHPWAQDIFHHHYVAGNIKPCSTPKISILDWSTI